MSVQEKEMAPRVCDKRTPALLSAIPIAKGDMTPYQLRKICVDFFRLQLSFPWIPDEDYTYVVKSQKKERFFGKDSVCAGLPYVTIGGGNLYRAMEFYDRKTGVLRVSELGKNPRLFGNACSGGSGTSWSRVITSAQIRYTEDMVEANGFLRVGPYTYDTSLPAFTKWEKDPAKRVMPDTIAKKNGKDVMFESYAAMQIGDGMVSPGHVRMCSIAPVVVRNTDGTVNGEESYLHYLDQCFPRKISTQADGSPIHVQGGIDVKLSFKNMFEDGYLPFTFAEFLGTKKVPDATLFASVDKACVTREELKEMSVSSNWAISDVFLSVFSKDGKEIYKYAIRTDDFYLKEIALAPAFDENVLDTIPDGARVEAVCQLYNGEKKLAFSKTVSQENTGITPALLHPLTRKRVEAIPVARDGMSEEELRQICLDYLKLQLSFAWMSDEDYHYVIEAKKMPVTKEKDVRHGGLPYVTKGSGNLYRVLEAYDENTGKLDLSNLGKNPRIFGNACSGSAGSAWSRVVTSARPGYTRHMTKHNGYLPVGPYTYDEGLEEFVKNEEKPEDVTCPSRICKQNGNQVMYRSYAALKPGDGIVSDGHVRMITSFPRATRSPEGTLSGLESSITYMDQVIPTKKKVDEDGEEILVQGGVEVETSFWQLLVDGYIPFTFAEFKGTSPVKEGKVTLNTEKRALTPSDLNEVCVVANYPISDLFVEAVDLAGNVALSYVHRPDTHFVFDVSLDKEAFLKLSKGEYELRLSAQLYNGEKVPVEGYTLTV